MVKGLNKLIIVKWMVQFGFKWLNNILIQSMEDLSHQQKVHGAIFKNKELKLCSNRLNKNLKKGYKMIYKFLQMRENLNNFQNSIVKSQ